MQTSDRDETSRSRGNSLSRKPVNNFRRRSFFHIHPLRFQLQNLTMRLTLLTASLSLFSSTYAGQQLNYVFLPDFCSISPQCTFQNLTSPEVILEDIEENVVLQNPIEEVSKPSPWTSEPQCITDTESNENFCVYTNKNFASGRGISFFTSPRIAARVEALPAFTNFTIHKHINNFTNPPWEVRNVIGRGNGLFATRTLHRGDEILSDTPVGVYQSDAFFPDYPLGYKYLHKAFEQLPLKTQRIFVKMAMHTPGGDPVMERINTNAFAGEFEGAPHFLLYPETAVCDFSYVSRG